MAASTDADYNAVSRAIECKIEIYLMGTQAAPLVVTRGNLLVDCSILDEGASDSETPFGNVTANELTFTLFNENGQFSPTNASSPYYGRMKRNVKCKAYLRSGTNDWDQVGEFYVSDWQATITGTTANVTANDKLYAIINSDPVELPVQQNISYAAFYTAIFEALGASATIDATLTDTLLMAYSVDSNSVLLTDLSTGAMAMCFCNHSGAITVKSMIAAQTVRATLTDANQIISVDADFSINSGYDGAQVNYKVPQESAVQPLLTVSPYNVPVGVYESDEMAMSVLPLVRLHYASIKSDTETSAYVLDLVNTSHNIKVKTSNDDAEALDVELKVAGTSIENTEMYVGDLGSNLLIVDNKFVQTRTRANNMLTVLRRYAASAMPVLTVQTRGNPLLNIGDKIVVQSTRYNLNFTGILLRQQFTYNGALTSTMTLLDASLLEVS